MERACAQNRLMRTDSHSQTERNALRTGAETLHILQYFNIPGFLFIGESTQNVEVEILREINSLFSLLGNKNSF